MRRSIILVAGLAIMLAGFVASMAMLGDQGRLKRLLSAHVETQLGRQLQIDGAVSLRFFPRVRIEAGAVRLSGSEAFKGLDLLESERVSAEVRLLPLILGRVETGEVSLHEARLNLLFDEGGGHNFSGLLHHGQRIGAPGILVDGPLRLEDLALQIGTLGTESLQTVSVERMELDGLAFDRALQLVFEGAIGMPAMIEDVTVTGVLFLPADSGDFHLADMSLNGRIAGSELPFQLSGALDFSARPPLEMTLRDGQLVVEDQSARIEGRYRSGPRPYFGVNLAGASLDANVLRRAMGEKSQWLTVLAGWTAMHDYDLDAHLGRLALGSWTLSDALVTINAADGLARVSQASARVPGGTIELAGDLVAGAEASLLSARAQVEIDNLEATLAAAGLPLLADGVGQLLLEPAENLGTGMLGRGSLRFFDGRVEPLSGLRVALGGAADSGFDVLEGRFAAYAERIEFPDLRVRHGSEELQFERLSVDASGNLSGSARLLGAGGLDGQVALSGNLAGPRYAISDGPLTRQ